MTLEEASGSLTRPPDRARLRIRPMHLLRPECYCYLLLRATLCLVHAFMEGLIARKNGCRPLFDQFVTVRCKDFVS